MEVSETFTAGAVNPLSEEATVASRDSDPVNDRRNQTKGEAL